MCRAPMICCWTLSLAAALVQAAEPPSAEAVVRANGAAFNAHDVKALAATVAEDLVWYQIDGDQVTVETRGRAALEQGMTDYFASLPSARSEFESLTVNGAFVAVKERALWKSSSGKDRSQTALAIYEVRDGLIVRVWYYPAQRHAPPSAK